MSEKERFFSFLERWETYARELPAEELRRLILAACGYAFRDEEPPADLPLAARMALVDMRARIDWEARIHDARATAGRASGKARANAEEQTGTKRNKREQKGTNTNSLKGMGREEKKTPICDRGKRKEKGAFLSWSNEDFRFAAEEVCTAHPEYRPYLDAFVGYWTEEHRDGGPRFRKMEAFSMASRLATWKRLQEQRAPQWPMMLPPPRTAQEALDLIPEANS